MARPYLLLELPKWGALYERLVGSYRSDANWADARPRLFRDKRYGFWRIADLRGWADRSLYFLGRWYDLRAMLLVDEVLEPGQTVVDVGGNYGHFTLAAAANLGKDGQVIVFEPNPASLARLRMHLMLNDLPAEVHEAGLADEPGTLYFYVPKINSGEASFAGSKYADVAVIQRPVVVGDAVLSGRAVDFIKVDVEGFEYRVMGGLSKTLALHQPMVLMEVVAGHLERAGSSPRELGDLMRGFEYRPYAMRLVRRGMSHRLRLIPLTGLDADGDVVWVSDRHKERIARLLQ